MAGLTFDIRGDNTDFTQKMSEVQKEISNTAKIASDQSAAIDALFGRLSSAAAKFGVSLSALGLGNKIMQTRGQFQQLEIAFNTMLGSAEKGSALMQQLVHTAAITPFDLKGVAQGAKQLLAYGIAAEEVNDTITRLGDIAAGLSIPLNDLVYLYGTTMTQGRMFTQDLRQFQGRGVPIADALAKQMGIAKNAVGDAVTAGKVDAQTFKTAIMSLASSGSQFGGLMQEQSKSITGQISNIEDALDVMFNDIGKSQEGVINTGLNAVSYLIENYEKVGKVLLVAATAFGTYKASLIATQAIEKIKNNSAIAGLEEEITKVNEEIAARERLNGVISQKPTQGASTVAGTTNTDNGKQTPQEKISGLQGTLSERQAILQSIKQEEAVEKQAKLNIAATEHNAAQSQLAIAQQKQQMAQSSLSLAQQEYAVAVKEKTEAEARVLLANQEVDARKAALAQAQKSGSSSDIAKAQVSLSDANLEKDAAYAAQTSANARYEKASRSLDTATEASNVASKQAEAAATNEQTAAENMHNAAVEKANALNALNAGETDKATIAARKEVVEIEAKTAALEAEIQRKRELLAMPADGGSSTNSTTETNPLVVEAQSKLSEQEAINAGLDEEFQKRVNIAQQELTSAQENYNVKAQALDLADQENIQAQTNLSQAIQSKEAIDEKVKSAKEYVEALEEANDTGDVSEKLSSAYDDLNAAVSEQNAAAKDVETASIAANTAEQNLNEAAQAANTAETELNTAQTNLNTASQRQQAASEAQTTVARTTNTGATAGNTAAITSNTLATKASGLANKAWIGIQTLFTGAVTATKNAFNGLKLAIASNPLGMLLTAVTTAISMLPILSDWLGLSGDEASESSEKFGEAADKTISNVNTLYEVINHSSSESKVYKDAMSELTSICEQYGIVVDKEGNLLDQVNGKRKELISLIQEEGAARIYANSVASAEQDYSKTIDDAQKAIEDGLDGVNDKMKGTFASIMTQSITGNMDELTAAYNRMEEIKSTAGPQWDFSAAGKQAWQEYTDLVNQSTEAVKRAIVADKEKELAAQGITDADQRHKLALEETKDAIKSVDSVANEQVRNMIEGNNTYKDRIDALNTAKEETSGLIDATSGLKGEEKRAATQAYYAGLKVGDLKTACQQLLTQYNNNKLDWQISLSLDTTKVPDWMKQQLGLTKNGKTTQKDADRAKTIASNFMSLANDDRVKKKGGAKVNGIWFTTEQINESAARWTLGASQAQEKVDKETAAKENQSAADKKKAEQAAKKAASEAKKRADEQVKANKAIAEKERQWSEQDDKSAQEREYAKSQAIIDAMEEGSKKTLAQLELDYKKEKDQLNREEDDILKTKIEREKQRFETQPKNKDKDFYKDGLGKYVGKTAEEMKKAGASDADIAKITLNPTDIEGVNAKRTSAEIKYNKDVEEVRKSDLESMRNYLKEYGTIQQQRVALIEEWDEKIAKAKASGDKGAELSAQAGKKQALADFDFEALQKSPEYIRAFGNLSETSTGTLQYLLDQFKDAISNGSVDTSNPEILQKYVDVVKSLNDALSDRNPFDAIRQGMNDIAAASAKKNTAMQKMIALDKQGLKSSKDYAKAQKDYNEAEDDELAAKNKVAKAINGVNEKIKELGSQISSLGDTIGGTAGDILGFIGNVFTFATTTADAIKTVGTATATAMGTIEKASAILAIIQAAIQLMQALQKIIPTAYSKYEKYAEKIAEINSLTEAIDEYKIAVAEARAEEKEWFSGTSLRNLSDYAKTGQEAIQAYKDKVNELQATYQNETNSGWLTTANHYLNPANWFGDTALGAVLGTGLSTLLLGPDGLIRTIQSEMLDNAAKNSWGASFSYDKSQTRAIDNLRIETRKKSNGFLGSGIGGHSQKTEDLRTWVKTNLGFDLFDEEGWLNTEAYEVVMDKYSDKLVGQTKETLEYLKKMTDEYNEWIDQLEEYVSNLYEPLVGNFTDALWDWFDDGKDALDSFKDYASDTFRDIVTDMMKSIMLSDFIDQFSDTVKQAYKDYGEGKISEDRLMQIVTAATDLAANTYEENLPVYQDILSKYSDMLEQYGIDLQGSNSSQSASGNSAENITQDQAEEIRGRLTAVQYSDDQQLAVQTLIYNALTNAMSLKTQGNAVLSDIRTQAALANTYLADISKDTRRMYTEWGEMITRMDKNINDKL